MICIESVFWLSIKSEKSAWAYELIGNRKALGLFIYLFILVLFYGENIGYKIALSVDWCLF